MEIRFYNQPQDLNLRDMLSEKLKSKNFKKITIFAGFTKDSALDILFEDIKYAIENGATVDIITGIDKKNTSKDMFLRLLNIGCKIRYHLNDDDIKVETRIYTFENENADSFVYLTGAKLSEGGLYTNYAIIEEIKYSSSEKLEFAKVKACIESGISNEDFNVLTEESLKELAKTGDILARITERKIPTIGELYNNTSADKQIDIGTNEYDENKSSIDYKALLEKDVDIDFDDTELIKEQDGFGDEVEHKIKSKKKSSEKVISKIVPKESSINYDKMSTLILSLTKVPQKGATAGEIKIPVLITQNMSKFFNYPNDFHIEEDEKGKLREIRKIFFEIYDVNKKALYKDNEAILIQNEKYTIIKSEKTKELSIEENDIMRLIKNEDGSYRCEIIKPMDNEYSIWDNFCTYIIKGTSKRYGII